MAIGIQQQHLTVSVQHVFVDSAGFPLKGVLLGLGAVPVGVLYRATGM